MKKPLLEMETKVEDAAQQAKGLLRSKYGIWALGGISFLESSLPVPLITDPFLIAYILADKKSVYKGVVVTFGMSLLGGLFAYIFAFYFYDIFVAKYVTDTVAVQFEGVVTQLQSGVFVVTLLGAVTPIPYTLVAFGAGLIKGNLFLFLLASVIGRGGRYILVGYITYCFGDAALSIVKRHIIAASIALSLLVVLYFAIKFSGIL